MNRVIKWIDAFAVAMSVTAVMLIFMVLTASAHAYLAESMPMNGALLDESPLDVMVQFSQEIESDGSVVRVLDVNGRQVDNKDSGLDLYELDHKTMMVSLPEQLPDGQYTVEWIVVSVEDGDSTDGAFVFGVGTDPLTPIADDSISNANSNENDFAAFSTSSDSIGWWVGGGIVTLIIGLLIAMLLLTRQPITKLE